MWYIEEHKKLVVSLNDGEDRFIIINMKPLSKKVIDGEKDNWWAFNAKQISREKLFDWNASGLLHTFREKSAEVLKDTKKQHSKFNDFCYCTFRTNKELHGKNCKTSKNH